MEDKPVTIEGPFIQCDKINSEGRIYSKEAMEKAVEKYETEKLTAKIERVNNEGSISSSSTCSNEPTVPNYSVFKMPLAENDRRHKEKQIAKRRHDKKLKKLQRQRKK